MEVIRSDRTTVKPRVIVIYTHFPHYRAPIFDALSRSEAFEYEFFYDQLGTDATILNAMSRPKHRHLKVKKLGPFMVQLGALTQACRSDVEAFIFLGNPFILTTWIAALIARFRGVPTLFWTHGWLKREKGFKALGRKIFYSISNGLLLYGNRAQDIGVRSGFKAKNLHVIYNSLNYESQKAIRLTLPKVKKRGATPFFLSVGRLVKDLELGLAFDAAHYLSEITECAFEIIVVGDGPLRSQLEEQADRLDLNVKFMGAVYDEEILGQYFNECSAVISPGKLGLLAMHALAYGAPVITHGELDTQMPEVEAIIEGITGAFFLKGNARDLAVKMAPFLESIRTEAQQRTAIDTVEADYTASIQASRIDHALSKALET